ncbi:TonB-dependent receptor [Tsuneonella dongtanensis]|nr:TonB-dependent receptor [Tsuneonella dongtanensis]
MLRAALLASAALAAVPATAWAQETGTASGDANVTGVGEIIVTAQRRAQNLQDVPAAVTALTGDALEQRQIADTNDLQNTIPNVVISTGTGTSNSARIYFRGIGEDESRGAIDPAVGIYIDDVYLGRTVGSLVDLVDIQQVEALRGPQGTLYGRNTNGGAIKVTSVRPQIGETSVAGELGYGNFDRIQGKATVNLAAWDSGAIRISGLYRERDGYFTINPNGALANLAGTRLGDEKVYALRGSFYGELSPDWSFLAIVDYTKDKSQPVPSSIIAESDNAAVVTDRDQNIFTIEPAPGATCAATTTSIGCFTGYRSEVDAFGVSYQLKGDLGGATLTSTTAYRTLKDDLASHITFPYFQKTDQNQFSQELLLNTNLGNIDLTGGAFYYNEDADLAFTFIFPFDIRTKTDSFAVFGQASAELGPVTVTGGLRWTTEDRTITSSAGGPLAGFGTNIVREFDTDNVTWTAKASYDLTDDIMVYASYATGTKSPGGSADCFSPAGCFLPVNEEKLDSIEGGLRAQFGPATFNATYFYNDYQDLQISGTLPNGAFTRINAGKARIQGVEIEFGVSPVTGLSLYGNASWLDGKYKDVNFNQAGLLTGSTNTVRGPTCTNATPGSATYQQQVIDCALGLSLKNAPEWKALVGFSYNVDMGGGEIFFGADAAYEADSFALVSNTPGSLVEPGVRIDARAGWKAADDRWSVTVWGKNLTDREYFRATTSVNQVYPAPPLTFGVDVGFKFN